MKKLFRWFEELFVWLTSKRVHDAINGEATYEEVCEIVKQELEK